jgi:hypothetical protein
MTLLISLIQLVKFERIFYFYKKQYKNKTYNKYKDYSKQYKK